MKLAVFFPLLCGACLSATAQNACPKPSPMKYDGPLQRGELLEHPVPEYPENAKAHGISGYITFRAHILKDGTVGHLTALSGPPELQESVEKTFYRWRYSPWTVNGQPVEAYTTLPANFWLPKDGNSPSYPPKPLGEKIPPLTLQGLLVRSFPARRPKAAEKANITGTVTLHVALDATGHIVDLGVLCGPEQLEDAALETVRHWIYQPYLSNGQPTAVESTIDIQF